MPMQNAWKNKTALPRSIGVLLAVLGFFFLVFSCESFKPLPVRASDGGRTLAVFRVGVDAQFFYMTSGCVMGDEPVKLILRDTNTGTGYKGQLLYKNYCFFPNLPRGTYELTQAETKYQVEFLQEKWPILVKFQDFKRTYQIDAEGVQLADKVKILTEQKDKELVVTQLNSSKFTDEEREDLREFINSKNPKAGWVY